MKGFSVSTSLAAASLLATTILAQTVDPIVIKGQHMFYKTNGSQFFIQGVAYQQDAGGNGTTSDNTTYTDPLADTNRCQQDIPLLKELNTNAIRVYAVNPALDHSGCMNLLLENDIYIISDLSDPSTSINRESPSWTDELYDRYTSVIDMFANYTNVIGFFAGNEVSNNVSNTEASAFVKAAVRDMKAYIGAKGYRQMYVGYATSDDAGIRDTEADYFNCGDQTDAIDFWGYNIYEWCGNSNYIESGYDQRTAEFQNYSVPAFFAEYGCNTVQPREFTEVQALFGVNMTPVFSGGFVYMYFQEANDYGLVDISSGTVSKLPDFSSLSAQMASISPSSTNMASYTPSNSPRACPALASGVWEAKSSPLPPSANPNLCACMMQSLSCVAKSSINADEYGTLFAQVCGYGSSICQGIIANATTGQYGAYSVCNATEQLSFAFNQYYLSQSKADTACNFGGAAMTQASASASGTCGSLLSQAGTAGTGSVTSSPTSGGSASHSSSKAAAGNVPIPRFDFGILGLGLYVSLAAMVGAGMILM